MVLSPLLLLKTQVMTDPVFRGNLSNPIAKSLQVGVSLVTTQGLGGLMRGSLLFSFKRVIDWISRYFFTGELEQALLFRHPNRPLTTRQVLTCAVIGGLLSTAVTMPLDMLVSIIQKAQKTTGSTWSIVYDTFWTNSIDFQSLSRGFTARALHVIFTTMVMRQAVPWVYNKWVYSNVKDLHTS